MKVKCNGICKIELNNLGDKTAFVELFKYADNKLIIDGKEYYLGDFDMKSVTLIEYTPSEHEIEIGDKWFTPTEKGGE